MSASKFCFRIATCVLVVGILWGIAMAASGKHATMPAHAHFNLLGWVSLFLMGVFYRLHPEIDAGRPAGLQAMLWIAGVVVQAIGVAMLTTGTPAGEPIAVIGSLALLVAAGLFVKLVFAGESG